MTDDIVKPGLSTIGPSWVYLRRAWKRYKVAKVAGDRDRMIEMAELIRREQRKLGIATMEFPQLGLENVKPERTQYQCPNCGQATSEMQDPYNKKEFPEFRCQNHECKLFFVVIARGRNE